MSAYSELITVLGAMRNAIVYGVRVRLPHASVTNAIFSSSPWAVIPKKVATLTFQHATNLALAAGIFKVAMLLLRRISPGGINVPLHHAVAGGIGGFLVWGRQATPVSLQVNLYMFSRILGGLATRFIESREQQAKQQKSELSGVESFFYGPRGYRVFAFLLWALAIHIFYEYPHALQPAMSGSLKYIYKDSLQHGHSLQSALLGW